MLNQCVVCPYRLGSVKTLVNPCLQCSAELKKSHAGTENDKNAKKDKKD